MTFKCLISAAIIIGCYSVGANAQLLGKETFTCHQTIVKAVAKFEDKVANAIESCLTEVQRCNLLIGQSNIDSCVGKLLIPGDGRCAVNKLGPGADYFGTGSATNAVDMSAIGKAYGVFIKQLSAKCDPALPIDFAYLTLSNPAPTSVNEVAEALNTNPNGAACLAHKRVLRTIPSRDSLVLQLANHPDASNTPPGLAAIILSANCK